MFESCLLDYCNSLLYSTVCPKVWCWRSSMYRMLRHYFSLEPDDVTVMPVFALPFIWSFKLVFLSTHPRLARRFLYLDETQLISECPLCRLFSVSLSLSPFMTGFLPPFHCRWFYIEFITVSWMLLNRDSDVDLRSWAKWPWNVHLSLGSACVSRRVSEFVVLWMVFFGICSVSYLMSALCTCLRIVVQVSYIAGFIDKSRWFKVLSDQRFVCILCPASLHCVIVDYSLSSCIFPNL